MHISEHTNICRTEMNSDDDQNIIINCKLLLQTTVDMGGLTLIHTIVI